MVKDLRAGEAAAQQRMEAARTQDGEAAQDASVGDALPPLKYQFEHNGEGWLEFDKEILYLFGGKGPLVARDFMQFPMSLPDDGYVDVVIQQRVRNMCWHSDLFDTRANSSCRPTVRLC